MSDEKPTPPDWFGQAIDDSDVWFAPGVWTTSAELLWPKICERMRPIGEPALTTERIETQELLDRVGSFLVSHSTERELLAVIRKLCECMIENGLEES